MRFEEGRRYYANDLEEVDSTGNYINRREIAKRFRVPPGNYVIIPSTFEEDKEGHFMIRIFTEQKAEKHL